MEVTEFLPAKDDLQFMSEFIWDRSYNWNQEMNEVSQGKKHSKSQDFIIFINDYLLKHSTTDWLSSS